MLLTITILFFGFWILSKESETLSSKFRLLFFGSLLFYSFLTYFQSYTLLTFIPKLLISVFIIALIGGVLNIFHENKIAQWIILCLSVVSVLNFQSKIDTFFSLHSDQKSASSKIEHPSNFAEIGEILIQLQPFTSEMLQSWLKKENATMRRAFDPLDSEITELDDYFLIDFPEKSNILDLLDQLTKMEYVIWAEANEMIPMEIPQKNFNQINKGAALTNDPSVIMQWHLQHLDMENYYRFFASKNIIPIRKTKLYILDTGIDTNHEDLNNPEGTQDKQGHGTHCAGVAAAITNNGIGVASMAPSDLWISVHGIQVIGDVGFGSQNQIITGIIKAADNGAGVISMSLGGITNQAREKAYNDAVNYANKKGAIVIVAAGNANLDGKRYSPANAENVITVTAINEKNEKTGFSNHVEHLAMGLAAPGEKILSTTPSNTYTSFNGTSMAAPQVAGLVAILKGINPTLSTQEVFKILHSTGKETQNTRRTGRLIQPLKAIQELTAGY